MASYGRPPSAGQVPFFTGTAWDFADRDQIYVVNRPSDLGSLTVNATGIYAALALVANLDDWFTLVPAGAASVDGLTVVLASNPSYVWQRLLIQSYINQAKTDWYVDANAGDDGNTGDLGNPVQNIEEVFRRLCPRGAVDFIQDNINIHLAAGSYVQMTCKMNEYIGAYIHVFGDVTSSSPITLATVTNTVASSAQRGRITTSSGTFVNKARLRCVSGSNVGAMAYVTGLTSSTDAFVTAWTDNTYSTVNLTSGDQVVVDTLNSTISAVDLENVSWDDGGGVWISDCVLSQGGNMKGSSLRDGIFIDGCELGSTSEGGWYGTASYARCRTTTVGGAGVKFENGVSRFIACTFQTTTVLQRNSWGQMEGANSSDGCSFLINTGSSLLCQQSGVSDAWEFENGGGVSNAVTVDTGCFLTEVGNFRLWGVTGNFTTGIVVHAGSTVTYGILPTIPSTTNVTLNSVAFTWAQLPMEVGSAVMDLDGVDYMRRTVHTTALSSAVGSTNLFASNPPAGLYRVSMVIEVTTAGTSGTITGNITGTGDSGSRTQSLAATPAISSTSLTASPFLVRTDGSHNITYSTTFNTVTAGSLQYSVSVVAERIGI